MTLRTPFFPDKTRKKKMISLYINAISYIVYKNKYVSKREIGSTAPRQAIRLKHA